MDASPHEWYQNAGFIWLVAGVLFLLIEALGVSGVGFLFAGLGALVAGVAVQMGWTGEEAYLAQFIVFFISVALWAALLWKPMQKFRVGHGRHGGGYSNIVGDVAYVGSSGLSKKSGGEVTWSGTIMKAQLAKHVQAEMLEAGTQVVIEEVTGATLIVKPKV
jgi:membrane protein implicated in regulation of membrane protease activity